MVGLLMVSLTVCAPAAATGAVAGVFWAFGLVALLGWLAHLAARKREREAAEFAERRF